MAGHIEEGQEADGTAQLDQPDPEEPLQGGDGQAGNQKLQRQLTIFMFQRLNRLDPKATGQTLIEQPHRRKDPKDIDKAIGDPAQTGVQLVAHQKCSVRSMPS